MNVKPLFPSDTPLHIRKLQIEHTLLKSNEDKLRDCFDMVDFTYNQTMNLLKKQMNTDDYEVLKFAYIEAAYKKDIKPDYLEYIKSKK
ncbi:MAG: hypothetical protein JWP81_4094 [Ferruginibacter sp.]|nr:hypothetical protein [Ferruginibacter sp.]